MTKRWNPLLEDQSATADVRELLQAGRDAQVLDYDYDAGLERHVAQVEAGAPMPDWAKGLEGSSGTGGAVAVAGSSLLGWLALPIAVVAVGGAVAWLSLREPPAPEAVAGTGTAVHAAPTAVSAGASTEGEAVAGEAVARAAGAPNHPAARAGREGREPSRTSASRAAAGSTSSHGRGALAARSAVTHKRPIAPAATRPGSKSAAAVVDKAAAPVEDLFAGSPIPTATRADNATRSPAAGVAADAEGATGNEAARSQSPSEQGAARAQAEPEPALLDDTRLEREMGMLSVSQRVLLSDPARSLSLARQGEAEFAGSMFTQERKQLELLALVKLGRVDEAKRLARPYLARYPNGPFSDRVRRALATGRVER